MQEMYNNLPKSLKSFFLSELSLQKQELVERLEGMKIKVPEGTIEGMKNIVRVSKIVGHNEALSDAIAIIKQ